MCVRMFIRGTINSMVMTPDQTTPYKRDGRQHLEPNVFLVHVSTHNSQSLDRSKGLQRNQHRISAAGQCRCTLKVGATSTDVDYNKLKSLLPLPLTSPMVDDLALGLGNMFLLKVML
jgi:hypothetical protein